ncbi:MAG: hypothetical protein RIB45_02275 [Marivibrio sp.]|uniref:hypothetical protein n=1 Tax=Marivibrio sp. TaxID=2039719 RepID=UPI0032EADED4
MAKKHRNYQERLTALGDKKIGVNVPHTVERPLKEVLRELVDAIRSERLSLDAAPEALVAALQRRLALAPPAPPEAFAEEGMSERVSGAAEIAPTKLVRFKYPPKGPAGAEWDRRKRQFELKHYRYMGRDFYWALEGLARSDQDTLLEAAHATGLVDDVVTLDGTRAAIPAR